MSPLSLVEGAVMATARLIAGRQRRRWLDAMEAELRTLREGRLDWALGSLVASVKDRVARDWPLVVALGALPGAALVAIPPLSMLALTLSRITGLSTLQLMPLVALAPAPFAVVLGAVRPESSPWLKGAVAFALYQVAPAIALSLVFGTYIYVRWEANLSAWGLAQPFGLMATGVVWCAGSWLGARWARGRRRGPPPARQW